MKRLFLCLSLALLSCSILTAPILPEPVTSTILATRDDYALRHVAALRPAAGNWQKAQEWQR